MMKSSFIEKFIISFSDSRINQIMSETAYDYDKDILLKKGTSLIFNPLFHKLMATKTNANMEEDDE